MIMPESAIVPSIATKPNGLPNSNKNTVTPIMPNGAVSNTMIEREILFSCSINKVNTTAKNNGMPAFTDF